jgi:hypothetical protein
MAGRVPIADGRFHILPDHTWLCIEKPAQLTDIFLELENKGRFRAWIYNSLAA